jgi:dihydrofolate synthase / folylpolyglutamate synthase
MRMSYQALLHRLFQINFSGGMKLGLQNVQELQKQCHFPDQQFVSIHVAGTNGKGSVATKIAYALQLAGYRVGLYTSPHLSCFRERIRINGEMISEQAVEAHLSSLFDLCDREHLPATFFELTTFLAFNYFAAQQVNITVLETGLGGRLDATNVVTPCLSVITSISLDHTEILGSTLDQIAWEKGGIIKPHVPVVIGPCVPSSIIEEIAASQHAPCLQVTSPSSSFEEENRSIALASLKILQKQFQISDQIIQQGVIEGKQPCRFEIVKNDPFIILDVAHNPDGLAHLFQALEQYAPRQSLRLLFGLSKNKDVKGCLNLIAAYGQNFHLVETSNGRGVPVNELAKLMQQLGVDPSKLKTHQLISQAVQKAREEAKKQGQILVICGSFFIMGEARQALGYQEARDFIDLNEKFLSSY